MRLTGKLALAIVAAVLVAEFIEAKPGDKNEDKPGKGNGRKQKRYNKSTRKSREMGEVSNDNLAALEEMMGTGMDLQTAVRTFTRAAPPGCTDTSVPVQCDANNRFRPINNVCNNLNNPYWGTPFTQLERLIGPDYDDGFNAPRGGFNSSKLPNARSISSTIHSDLIQPDFQITHLVAMTGLIVDHDMTFSPESDFHCCSFQAGARDCMPLEVSTTDSFYSKFNVTCLDFTRSTAYCFPGTTGVRQQMNMLTAFLDASLVYGSEPEVTEALREHSGGRLLRNSNNARFLPTVEEVRKRTGVHLEEIIGTFAAGDNRINEMPGLTTMQTLWFREHNRLASEIQSIRPLWSDEQIFQLARRLVIAQWQKVVYGEYLPVIMGPDAMTKYQLSVLPTAFSNYNPSVNPGILQAFSTAAYRFGHTIINGFVNMIRDVQTIMTFKVRDGFFNDSMITFNNGEGFELLLNGLLQQNAQTSDRFITQELTNFLLREPTNPNFGSDLAARNIQRGRDHGVPAYGEYRKTCGLPALTSSWSNRPAEITAVNWAKLQSVYTSPLDIDLFPGGLSETPVTGGLTGPVFNCIKGLQLQRTKFGDRFFYTHQNQAGSFTTQQLVRLNNQNFGDIICRNSNLQRTPFNVLRPVSGSNPWIYCSDSVNRRHIYSGDFV